MLTPEEVGFLKYLRAAKVRLYTSHGALNLNLL